MNIALLLFTFILVASFIFMVLLLHVFAKVTRKRREFMAGLGRGGNAVVRFKQTLLLTYVISTFMWSILLLIYFFYVA